MWDYLKRVYYQDNTARQFHLELEMSNFSQGNLSIELYYSGFLILWSEYSGIIYTNVLKETLASLQAVHEVSRHDQFLIKLRPEFEAAWAGLLNRVLVPSLDLCLGELLCEEKRLATQVVLGASRGLHEAVNVSYAVQERNRGKGPMQCFSYRKMGHIARNCGKKFCNYCKQNGHIIKDCPTRKENQQNQAFQAAVLGSQPTGYVFTIASNNQSILTPEMVQQMIILAFSALELQGQGKIDSFPWIVDFGASNHMTGMPNLLYNLHKYTRTQSIQVSNGSNLPITAIGDIGPSFNHVFVSPGLLMSPN